MLTPYYATSCQLLPPAPVVESTSVQDEPPVVVSSTALQVKTDNGLVVIGIFSPVTAATGERIILTPFTLVDKSCPAIVGAIFGDTELTDRLVFNPDTLTVMPVESATVPTADVIELLAIVGASFNATVPVDKLEDVPVTEIV